jgi:hypothetical protein
MKNGVTMGKSALVAASLLLVALVFVGSALAEPDDYERKSKSNSPVQLFQGVKAVTQAGLGTALDAATITMGSSNDVNIFVCDSVESLANTLEINVEASIEILGLASISVKGEYLHEVKMDTYNLAVVVRAQRNSGTRSVVGVPTFRDPASVPAATQESVEAFYNAVRMSLRGPRSS